MRSILVCVLVAAAGCGGSKNDNGSQDMAVPGDLSAAMDLAVFTCDPVKQNCTDATNAKCTLKNMGTMDMPDNQRACVPLKGTKKDGEACTRTEFGDDDCDKGLACTLRGASATDLRCHKFCHADTDCGAGEVCTGQLSQTDTKDGLCVPTCTPFGTECGTPFVCGELYQGIGATQQNPKLVLTCRGLGTARSGDGCMTSSDCAVALLCDPGVGACVDFCDDNHPCVDTTDGGAADGGFALSCATFGALPDNGGICQ